MPGKVVLVTGSKGLAGHALRDLVRSGEKDENEEWHFIDIEDADLRDRAATLQLFEKIQPTHVIHLAALVGGLFYNLHRPLDMFRDNMAINDNVLYASYHVRVKKVISAMTCAALPKAAPRPLTENMLHQGLPHGEMFGYAMSKRMIDVLNRVYNRLGNHVFTSVIPPNLFGPHDNFHLRNGHVVANTIYKTYIARKRGTPLTILGSGIARRQFLFAYDFAKLLIWAMREYEEKEPIILAPNEDSEMTIQEMTSKVTKVMGFKGEILFDRAKSDGNLKWTMSNAKLRKYLPDFKFTSFDKGVKKTIDWFEANILKARL